jgi:hypothetical protein
LSRSVEEDRGYILGYQTTFYSDRKNQDIRIQTAFDFLNQWKFGNFILHKTTRAGCTTAMVSEFLNRDEKFIAVVPTNWLASKTIIDDAQEYSDVDDVDIVQIPSNHKCRLNELEIKKCPDLKHIPILPIPENCRECDFFYNCPITDVIHKGRNGIVLTYHKIVALMLASEISENSNAAGVVRKLLNSKNLLMDECHELQNLPMANVGIYTANELGGSHIKFDKYVNLPRKHFKGIHMAIAEFGMLVEEEHIRHAVFELYNEAMADDYWLKHLSKRVKNTYHGDHGKRETFLVRVYTETIELMKSRKMFGLEVEDILQVYSIVNVLLHDNISMSAYRDGETVCIRLTAVDQIFNLMIRKFIREFTEQEGNHRAIMTSATMTSFDFKGMFKGESRNIIFGRMGDPMSNNSNMLIVADKKKYSVVGSYSVNKKMDDIIERGCYILEKVGCDNCLVVSMNMRVSGEIKKRLKDRGYEPRVLYYKSPKLMGVSAKERVLIAIGSAFKPVNSFDCMTDSRASSDVMIEESMHTDTWQAMSRVKDPAGVVPSLVFAFGVREQECRNIVTWGVDRNINLWNEGQRRRVAVSCGGNQMSTPVIYEAKDTEDGLLVADMHTRRAYNLASGGTQKYPISVEWEEYENQIRFMRLFVGREDTIAEQGFNGSYFKVPAPINDTILERHVEGKITIGSYSLTAESTAKFVCFDVDAHRPDNCSDLEFIRVQEDAEREREKLEDHLNLYSIPYIVESSGTLHSYHVWIILKEIESEKAYHFGRQIAKECGLNSECEITPKQKKLSSRQKLGNLIKLPYATHKVSKNKSKIRNGCVFSNDFQPIMVGVVDISNYDISKKVRPNTKKGGMVRTIRGIRPCISEALNKDLSGEQGNFMRVAIVREYWNFGVRDLEELGMLFQNQTDFDIEKSMYHIGQVIEQEYGVWRRDTLLERCPKFIDCTGCERVDCKGAN